jgi:hypothetical protein
MWTFDNIYQIHVLLLANLNPTCTNVHDKQISNI